MTPLAYILFGFAIFAPVFALVVTNIDDWREKIERRNAKKKRARRAISKLALSK